MFNAKKWFFVALGLSAAGAGTMAYVQTRAWSREASARAAIMSVGPADPALGFGPEMEAVLPAATGEAPVTMLNLQTGSWSTAPSVECRIEDIPALVTWMHTNGVNISGRVWPSGGADCITYNMAVVPVDPECWEKAATEAIHGIPVAIQTQHSPRRLLVLGKDKPSTYAFRTDSGALGLLRLVDLSDDGQAVNIQYKLVKGQMSGSLTTN